jgi:hypothetical protein
VAEELQLKLQPTMQCIRGYAGGATRASGVTDVTLTVDLVTADVTVYVVADEVQSVPIIIRQSFLDRACVTMVLRDNRVSSFEKHLAALPDIGNLPPRKLALWAKDTVVIPPHTIGFIAIGGPENFDGEVQMGATNRQKPGHEYSIPGCVTTIGGVLSIRDMADNNLKVSAGQLLVRGVPCSPENSMAEVTNFSIQEANCYPCSSRISRTN